MTRKAHLDRLRLLRRQLDSVLDAELAPGRGHPASGETPGAWIPAVDILETEAAYEVRAELPGVRKQDIELRIVDAQLEMLGQRRAPAGAGSFHRMEGRYGPFHRIVALGLDADEDGIEARLQAGVLCVRVKKQKPSEERKEISVRWGDEDA